MGLHTTDALGRTHLGIGNWDESVLYCTYALISLFEESQLDEQDRTDQRYGRETETESMHGSALGGFSDLMLLTIVLSEGYCIMWCYLW
jgi:hypothetical protein